MQGEGDEGSEQPVAVGGGEGRERSERPRRHGGGRGDDRGGSGRGGGRGGSGRGGGRGGGPAGAETARAAAAGSLFGIRRETEKAGRRRPAFRWFGCRREPAQRTISTWSPISISRTDVVILTVTAQRLHGEDHRLAGVGPRQLVRVPGTASARRRVGRRWPRRDRSGSRDPWPRRSGHRRGTRSPRRGRPRASRRSGRMAAWTSTHRERGSPARAPARRWARYPRRPCR